MLEYSLPFDSIQFFKFLSSIRTIHELCTARVLKNFNDVIEEFKRNFYFLYENVGLNMTLKIHIILDHYKDYFEWTAKTFRHTNGEFVESSHYTIKKEEATHGFKVKRTIGTPGHLEKSFKSIVWHNTRRAGFTSPSKFMLRNNTK